MQQVLKILKWGRLEVVIGPKNNEVEVYCYP